MKKEILNLITGRVAMQKWFQILYSVSLRGMNYGNGGNFRTSGERFVAEYICSKLSKENQQLDEFRKNILAIQGFENLLNDIIYNTAINTLIKIEDSAKHYSTLSFSEFKDALNADYAKFKPYASIFSELASAMKGFADKAKEIPEELIGIDKQEYDEYIALNT